MCAREEKSVTKAGDSEIGGVTWVLRECVNPCTHMYGKGVMKNQKGGLYFRSIHVYLCICFFSVLKRGSYSRY